jgi:regulatory protein
VRQSSPAEPAQDPATRVEHALAFAYRYIDRREHSVEEVRRHLEAKGVQPQTVEEVLRLLGERGQLDDARFACLFAEDKRELEGWGAERIRRGLIGRGIEREVAETALAGADAESELDRAVALLRRRFQSPPADRRERERALGVLVRKGYESELALDALAAFARGE